MHVAPADGDRVAGDAHNTRADLFLQRKGPKRQLAQLLENERALLTRARYSMRLHAVLLDLERPFAVTKPGTASISKVEKNLFRRLPVCLTWISTGRMRHVNDE